MSDVTRILDAIQAGQRQAASELLRLLYDELGNEAPVHTLNATALFHEERRQFPPFRRTYQC
jgi:hypothetical protein